MSQLSDHGTFFCSLSAAARARSHFAFVLSSCGCRQTWCQLCRFAGSILSLSFVVFCCIESLFTLCVSVDVRWPKKTNTIHTFWMIPIFERDGYDILCLLLPFSISLVTIFLCLCLSLCSIALCSIYQELCKVLCHSLQQKILRWNSITASKPRSLSFLSFLFLLSFLHSFSAHLCFSASMD
jgi:hypothetical protein